MEFASNPTLGENVDSCVIYACVSGDVGTGHILSSKRLKQDEIEVLNINGECTSNSFSPSPNGTISTFLTLSSTFIRNLLCRAAHGFVHKHSRSFTNTELSEGFRNNIALVCKLLSLICLMFRCVLLPKVENLYHVQPVHTIFRRRLS